MTPRQAVFLASSAGTDALLLKASLTPRGLGQSAGELLRKLHELYDAGVSPTDLRCLLIGAGCSFTRTHSLRLVLGGDHVL